MRADQDQGPFESLHIKRKAPAYCLLVTDIWLCQFHGSVRISSRQKGVLMIIAGFRPEYCPIHLNQEVCFQIQKSAEAPSKDFCWKSNLTRMNKNNKILLYYCVFERYQLSVPRTFARPELGTHHSCNPHQSHNPRFYYSTYIGVYLNNSFITTIQRFLWRFVSSISVILHFLVCL